MSKDDLKDFFEDDAYNDLLNLYAEEASKKEKAASSAAKQGETPANPKAKSPSMPYAAPSPTSKAKEPTERPYAASSRKKHQNGPQPPKFQVNIEGLDEEFEAPKPERKLDLAALKTNLARKKTEIQQMEERAKDESQTYIAKRGDSAVPVKERLKLFFFRNINAFIAILVCLLLAIGLSMYTISCLNDVFAVHRDSETPIEVEIPLEATTKDVLKILQDHDLIHHRHFCKAIAKLDKLRNDNYLAGVYYLTPSMGFERMLLNIKQPAKTGETVTLTFPEGFTVDQILKKLEENKVCTALNVEQVMSSVDFSSEFSFIKEMDQPQARYRMLEGYLYPDTYDFYVNENPTSVVRKFLSNFQKKWSKEYAEQAKKMNMSVDDVITLASIIQKESAGPDQSPAISSVLHNRLNKSALYPSLQCDSTTEYIEEYIKKNTGSASAVAAFTAKYSTYKCVGLPVGAICNPGDDAIRAALHPKKTNYYFFAHDNNKKIYLATNDAERRANNLAIMKANADAEKNKNH